MRGATPCSLSNVDPKCICDLFGCSDDNTKALLEVCEKGAAPPSQCQAWDWKSPNLHHKAIYESPALPAVQVARWRPEEKDSLVTRHHSRESDQSVPVASGVTFTFELRVKQLEIRKSFWASLSFFFSLFVMHIPALSGRRFTRVSEIKSASAYVSMRKSAI